MRKFLLITKSDSGDDYQYFIQSLTQPTRQQLIQFLIDHGNDSGEGMTWENIDCLIDITDEEFITI
jgi:hypothetical protein